MGRWHVRKTKEEFSNELRVIQPYVSVIGQYIDSHTNIEMYCDIHNETFLQAPTNALSGKLGCPICAALRRGRSRRKSNDQFLQEVAVRHPNLIVNSEYISSEVKVNCTCRVCGHISDYYPVTLTHGSGGCFVCGNRKISQALTMSEDEFISMLKLVNDSIFVIDGYTNASNHVNVRCAICDYEWSPVAKSLLQGVGCPQCASSHGERIIRNYLNRYNVVYTPQKTFDNLIGLGNGLLSYDFYLPEYNLLIEYQGEYHDGTAQIQTIEEFKKQQEHDKRKREYAKIHNFKMLEIWYWDFDNIEEILNNTLHNLVTTTAV